MRYKTNRYEVESVTYRGGGDEVMFQVDIFSHGPGPKVSLYLTAEDAAMFIRAFTEHDSFAGYHHEVH